MFTQGLGDWGPITCTQVIYYQEDRTPSGLRGENLLTFHTNNDKKAA